MILKKNQLENLINKSTWRNLDNNPDNKNTQSAVLDSGFSTKFGKFSPNYEKYDDSITNFSLRDWQMFSINNLSNILLLNFIDVSKPKRK